MRPTVEFLQKEGYEVDAAAPKNVERLRDDLADYHVVVGLSPEARDRLGEVPFHTAFLVWKAPEEAEASLDHGSSLAQR